MCAGRNRGTVSEICCVFALLPASSRTEMDSVHAPGGIDQELLKDHALIFALGLVKRMRPECLVDVEMPDCRRSLSQSIETP